MATNAPSQDNLYLDSNFLVSYFVPHHKHHKGSVVIFASLLSQNNTLNLSPLTLDETFHAIRNEHNYVRKKQGQAAKPHSFFYSELKAVTDQLIKFPQVRIRQFESVVNDNCELAVDNIKNHNLAPKDAFHLAYMHDWGVKYIITNDSNFNSVASVQKVTY